MTLRSAFWRRFLGSVGQTPNFGQGIQFWDPKNVEVGDNFLCLRHCTIAAGSGGTVKIGDDVSLNSNVCIDASDGGLIVIGNGSGIAHNSVLRSSSHHYSDPNIRWTLQGHKPGKIVVGEDVWVAANVILLPGTVLERGCVVASGSVVGGTFSAFSVVAGNPARIVGRRGDGFAETNNVTT